MVSISSSVGFGSSGIGLRAVGLEDVEVLYGVERGDDELEGVAHFNMECVDLDEELIGCL